MAENTKRLIVFMDILGFGATTMVDKRRIRHSRRGHIHVSGTTTMSNRANQFTGIVEGMLHRERLNTPSIRGMVFSDCAYLDFGAPTQVAQHSSRMMRMFVHNGLPVRMGIGYGTFYPEQFSTLVIGNALITKSVFFGTGVVTAYNAEHAGGKGMRIFVHPDAATAMRGGFDVKLLDLPKSLQGASAELNYLVQRKEHDYDEERSLYQAVASLFPKEAPLAVRRQYLETFKALDRMCRALGRRPIPYKSLPGYGSRLRVLG